MHDFSGALDLLGEFSDWFATDNGLNAHIYVFVLLILGGLGFPVPEDMPLIIAGILVYRGTVGHIPIALTSYLGVLLSDQFLYFVGYRYGKKLVHRGINSPWLPSLTLERVAIVRAQWKKYRYFLIIAARHVFPIRAVTFLSAGTLHVPYIDFLVADAVAATISVTLTIYIGYLIGESLPADVTKHLVDRIHYYVGLFFLLIVVVYSVRYVLLRTRYEDSK